MVGRFGRPLGDLVWISRGFPSIRPQNRPLQENLQYVQKTYKIPCISIGITKRKMIGVEGEGRLQEGGWWVEWSDKMTRIIQNSKPSLGDDWICSTCLEKFP